MNMFLAVSKSCARHGLAISILLLAGCVTQAERTAQMEREVDEMIQVYGPACEKLGYKADSDQWRDCVLRLSTKDSLSRYSRSPTMTSCFGHRGFFQCSSF
jgi:hypothetical protein